MARKNQWRRKLMREAWVNTVGSTADRDTKADDIRTELYAWKVPAWKAGPECPRMRKDIIA